MKQREGEQNAWSAWFRSLCSHASAFALFYPGNQPRTSTFLSGRYSPVAYPAHILRIYSVHIWQIAYGSELSVKTPTVPTQRCATADDHFRNQFDKSASCGDARGARDISEQAAKVLHV